MVFPTQVIEEVEAVEAEVDEEGGNGDQSLASDIGMKEKKRQSSLQ